MSQPFAFPLDRHHVEPIHDIPDHAEAFASILCRYAKLIRRGRSAEDCARELVEIARVAARRT